MLCAHPLTLCAPEFCSLLSINAPLRDSVSVPDGSRVVFGNGPGATVAQLNALSKELADLCRDVLNENVRSFKKLAEARVEYPLVAPTVW